MSVKERLQEIFRSIFDDESLEIFEEMTSEDIEEWDSLTHMNLILDIEKEFGIKFTTKEITKAKNVGEFLAIIEGKIS
ncbi:MAG: acyl carrier protein [Clostridium sp.]|nr:acyl carrier protein [Clostridium sp.]